MSGYQMERPLALLTAKEHILTNRPSDKKT